MPPPSTPRKRTRLQTKPAENHHHGDLGRALKESALLELDAVPAFTHLSLRAIARRVGVSHAAAYRHYENLDALLDALAVDGFRELAGRLAAPTTSSPRDAFLLLGQKYITFAIEQPKLFSIMFGRGVASSRRNDALSSAIHSVLKQIDPVAKALAPELGWSSGKELGVALWSFGHGLATLVSSGDIRSKSIAAVDALARRLLDQLFPEPRPLTQAR